MNCKRCKEAPKENNGNFNTEKYCIENENMLDLHNSYWDTAEERSVNLKKGQKKLFKLKNREKKDAIKINT